MMRITGLMIDGENVGQDRVQWSEKGGVEAPVKRTPGKIRVVDET